MEQIGTGFSMIGVSLDREDITFHFRRAKPCRAQATTTLEALRPTYQRRALSETSESAPRGIRK